MRIIPSLSARRASAGGENVRQRVEVEDEADGGLAAAEVGRQVVVSPAAADARASALDVDFEDEPRVVVEPRHVRQIDREAFAEPQRLDRRQKFLKLVE